MNVSRAKVFAVAAVLTASGLAAAWIPPARAAIEAVMSCAKTTPCLEWDNSMSGDAVKGVSTSGNALHGQTKFKSAGKTSGRAGVFGEDLSTSGNLNAGVSGVSKNGAGVLGTSTNWNGMEGLTTGAGTSGVYGQNGNSTGFGVAGRNVAPSSNSGAGVLADGGPANDGLHATSASGHAGLFQNAAGNRFPSIAVIGGTAGGQGDLMDLFDVNSNLEVEVADNGSVAIAGLLFTSGSCRNGCVVGNHQTHSVTEYTPTESEPTIEDFGTGMLVNGRADVVLDQKFANVIDSDAQYFVWAMPEGDCRGLYVASQTIRGFTVRELQSGHSSVPFEYRVVAKRYGIDSQRLPMTPIRPGIGPLSPRQHQSYGSTLRRENQNTADFARRPHASVLE